MAVPKKRKLRLRRMRKGVLYFCYHCSLATTANWKNNVKELQKMVATYLVEKEKKLPFTIKRINRTCNACTKKMYGARL